MMSVPWLMNGFQCCVGDVCFVRTFRNFRSTAHVPYTYAVNGLDWKGLRYLQLLLLTLWDYFHVGFSDNLVFMHADSI